jgi:hypothetical protein
VPLDAFEALLTAVRPILAAHRSTDGHVTVEQVTEAWAAYDAARTVQREAPERLGRAIYRWRFPDDAELRQHGDNWTSLGRALLMEVDRAA